MLPIGSRALSCFKALGAGDVARERRHELADCSTAWCFKALGAGDVAREVDAG